MNYFKNFPQDATCPICGTNENGECFLMPIDGTERGNFCEAVPTHRICAGDAIAPRLRYDKHDKIVYVYSSTQQ